MSTRLKRLILPLARDVKAGKPMGFKHRSAAEQILFLLRKPPRRGTKPAKERKLAKAAAHRESTGAIREAVFARAGGYCELDMTELHAASDMHHLEGGPTRRSHQAVSNCMAVCRVHHDLFHRRPEAFRNRILNWRAAYSYPTPRRFLRPAPAAAQTPLGHSGSEAGGKE